MKVLHSRRYYLLVSLFLAATALSHGQDFYPISGGNITACSGVLEDSGGGFGQYGNNENFTSTICPDTPGDAISLNWLIANLSLTGPNPPDRIRIFDGDNTGANSLGEYTGTELQTLIVSATTFNATGCLTVQFLSNANGVGDFAASITCYTPCERPTAVATMSEALPALICVGEEISFDGSGSFAASTFDIVSYTWDFDDGTTGTGQTASHSFSVPGEYIVQLNLLDNNDCANSNVVDLQVLVSTTPTFNGTTESVISCAGATVDLTAVVEPVTWTGIPDANFGGSVYLPDDPGLPFTSEINFEAFEPGQTITNTSNILSICVEMEHSYMGDLVLQVICPNGQSMFLHQQGGGNTYLGSPYDFDTDDDPIAGECWQYCWSPTATNGTWQQNSNNGPTPNTMPGGFDNPGNSLIPGTYQPVGSFNSLVGCPLNGEWTYQSTDFLGADNGFICSWSIEFDPAIIPDVTQFTPELGTSTIDSAAWTGTGLVVDPATPLNATASLTTPGTYFYDFSVTDNFGCTYDTTISITVPEIPVLDAGPDLSLCSDPLPMAGEITANGPASNCIWNITLYESFGDGWNGGASLAVTVDGVTTNYTVPSGPDELTFPLAVSSGDEISLTYTAGTIFNAENSYTLFNDEGVEVYSSVNNPPSGNSYSGTVVCGGGSPFTFVWTPAIGLADPGDPTTTVFVTEPTMFYLSTYPVGFPECAVTDSVLVAPDPSIDAGLSNDIILCASDPVILLTDSLGGTPDAGGTWTNAAGAVVANTYDPANGTTDTFTYTVISPNGCTATSTLAVTIIPADDPTCCGVADAGTASFSCSMTNILEAIPGNTGVGVWTGPTGAVFGDATQDTTTVTMPAGSGGTYMFYWVENDGAFCNLIDSVEKTFTDAYEFTPTLVDALCFSFCDGEAQVAVTGGNAENGLTYEWSTGLAGVNESSVVGLCAGDHSVSVIDDNGCEGEFTITIGEPVLLEIDSLATGPVTCSGDCDGQVEIYDPEAVEYSYDGGASWSVENISTAACEGIFNVSIRNDVGCVGNGAITVTGPPPVVADFIWGPDPANVEDPTIEFLTTSSDAERYFWNIANLASSTDPRPSFTFSNKEPGIYEVCLVAYNFNDCADTICKNVIINDVLFSYVPNSFTPDGDGVNDAWGMVVNIPVITDFELMVFDRWGQMVYNTTDVYDPWLGSYQNGGEILKSDVYAYRIIYGIEGTEARKEIIGHVTLLK